MRARRQTRDPFASAPEEGAKVLTGGRAEGWWIRPTVLVDVGPSMRVSSDEIFGPVVTVQPFDGEDEGVALAKRHALRTQRHAVHGERPEGPPGGGRLRPGTV